MWAWRASSSVLIVEGRNLIDTSFEIGKAAFVGRVLGTVAKLAVCSIMVIVTLAALVLE